MEKGRQSSLVVKYIPTYLQDSAARLQTGIIHTGLVHAQRDAVQQDDQYGDALEPRARSRVQIQLNS